MKDLKYLIFGMIVVIIIIIVLILIIMNGDKSVYTDEVEYNIKVEINKKVDIVNNKNNYYVVKNIVNNYYYDLTQFNMNESDVLILDEENGEENSSSLTDSINTERQAYKNKVYNYLDKEFIEKNKVTKENIQSILGDYKNVVTIINDIYYYDINESQKIYLVNGKVIEKENSKKQEFIMTIMIDTQNSTFLIYPNGNKYNMELRKELNLDNIEINTNNYNKYNYRLINNETYALDIFNDLKNRIMYDIDSVYNRLNGEYKEAKFINITEFKNYIKNNYYKYVNANISNYRIENMQEYEQCLCLDSKGNSYIFKVTAPMQYTVILDTYTIDIPEFTEKYNTSNNQEKVMLNINKFMLALNDGDYKYAYGVLADSFKTKNFPTYESFEDYAKSSFFKENKFEYTNFGDEAGTYYTYKVNITDGSGTSKKTITKTFIMLLEAGTEFQLSFNI